MEDILNEIDIMKEINTPYVVEFYGNYFYENHIWVCAMRNLLFFLSIFLSVRKKCCLLIF